MADETPWANDPIVSRATPADRPDPDRPWLADAPVEVGATEKLGAFGQAATGGFIESGTILSGMAAGAGIGTLGGPAAPVTVPLGAAAGAAAGFFAGRGAKNLLGIEGPEQMPEELRPWAFSGDVIGAGVPFAAAPFAAVKVGARLPASKVGSFINKVIDTAERAPWVFARGEAFGLFGAATAAGAAESYLPGNTGVRLAAEVGIGLLSPVRLLSGVQDIASQSLSRAARAFSADGRKTAAAKVIQEILAESGEDPTVLAQLLRDSGIPGTNLTTAQRTGSPGLVKLETKLAQDSAKFGAEAQRRAKDALDVLNDSIVALRSTGDPQALTQAAELRLRYFRVLLSTRLQSAEREAMEAAGKITTDSPRDMAALSKKANEALSSAMSDARAAEADLWGKVQRDIPAGPKKIIAAYDDLRAGMLPEEEFPRIVEGFVERMQKQGGKTTSGELMLFRSRALALAREAGNQGKANDARIYGRLAEAALDDIDGVFSGQNSGVLRTFGATQEAYDAARAFSRELHETFTRSFAGTAMSATSRGGDRIPPEVLMRRALATGKEIGELRLREIEEATGFMARVGMDSPEAAANVSAMLDAQERVLRLAASEALDPNTGRVSATRLGRFIQNHDALLEKFPEVAADLKAALGSEMKLKDVLGFVDGASRMIEKRTAFAHVAKVENPADVVRAAIRGVTPVNDLTALAKLARRGGPEATDGLKATVFDYALDRATSSTGEMSLETFYNALFKPIGSGEKSVAQVMRSEGVFSEADVSRLGELFERAVKIEKAAAGNKSLDSLLGDPDAATDMILRIVGAKFGAAMASGTSGATLVAAGRGSSFARSMFENMPNAKVMAVLREAALNPDLMARLLERPKTRADGIRLARQIHSYILQAGITGMEEDGQP